MDRGRSEVPSRRTNGPSSSAACSSSSWCRNAGRRSRWEASERTMARSQICIHFSTSTWPGNHWQALTMTSVLGRSCCGGVAVDRFLMGLEILQPAQIYRLARAEFADDDPHHGIVGLGGQVPVGGITAEVHEIVDQVLKIGPGSVGIAEGERPDRNRAPPPATHIPPYGLIGPV